MDRPIRLLSLNVDEASQGEHLFNYLDLVGNFMGAPVEEFRDAVTKREDVVGLAREKKWGADVICLQEVTEEVIGELMTRLFGDWDYSFVERDTIPGHKPHGNAIIWRNGIFDSVEIDSAKIMPQSENTRPSVVLRAKIRAGDDEFILANVHGMTHLGRDSKRDTEDRLAFFEALKTAFAGDYPLILIGDFNADSGGNGLKDLEESLGVHNWLRVGPFKRTRSEITRETARSMEWEFQPESDWAMTRGMSVEMFEVVQNNISSDHWPIKMHFWPHIRTDGPQNIAESYANFRRIIAVPLV